MRKLAAIVITIISLEAKSYSIPSNDQVVTSVGQPSESAIQSQFKLLVWNIQKATEKERWHRDFMILAAEHDMMAFQEANQDEFTTPVWQSMLDYQSVFATSFYTNSYRTGVMTSSRFRALGQMFLRSSGRELYFFTPKMALLTYYQIDKPAGSTSQVSKTLSRGDLSQSAPREILLVANIHALNFQFTNAQFYKQVDEILAVLKQHNGPVLFVGDFNTWNPFRTKYLREKTAAIGLTEAQLENDFRNLKLDHAFYRGLRMVRAQVLMGVDSSDHYPMSFDIETN